MSTFLIDKDNLDEEWVKQPDRMWVACKRFANRKADYSDLKAELDVFMAELALKIRKHPEKHGLVKVTDESVKNAITANVGVIKRVRNLNKLKRKIDISQAAINALEHKKKGLEDLVVLHGRDYFSTPKARGDRREEMENKVKRSIRQKGRKHA